MMGKRITQPQSQKFVDDDGFLLPEWVQFLSAMVRLINDLSARVEKLEQQQ